MRYCPSSATNIVLVINDLKMNRMKQFSVWAVLLIMIGLSVSCNKSSSSGPPSEMPFQTAVNENSLVNLKKLYSQNSGGAEVGYKMHFTKNGTVTQLGTEMGVPGSYSVSFWDFSAKSLLSTVTVKVTDTSHFFYASVPTPITVDAGTEYVLTFHIPDGLANPHWNYKNTSGATLYPFSVDDIVADELLDVINLPSGNNTPTFPSTVYAVDQYFLTDCDLVFTPSN
jgi:hypothetical protein